MNESQAMEVLERTLKLASADDVVATFAGGTHYAARFADNAITQSVRQSDSELSVSCAYDTRHASASTNELSEEAVKATVERAESAARLSPPDPEYMPPVESGESDRYPKVHAHYPETAEFNPRARAEEIASAAQEVAARGYRLSGAFSSGESLLAVANSAGLRALHRSTHAEIHATVLGDNGSGWAEKTSNNIGELDARAVTSDALAIAAEAQDPGEIRPGKYTVILRPAAVRQLLPHHMIGDAKAADEGRSFLREKLGRKVCGENVTIRSDPADPRCPGHPFMMDGLASPTITWVEKGVLGNLATSRYWAKKTGRAVTGYPSNVIVDGGDSSVEEMIASTERGLLVTRLWYIRFVDPMTCLLTGMTRDGLFLIEDGRVSRAVKHLRFNESVPEALSRVEALGPVERSNRSLVPPMKIRDFHFTSGTRF